jgi:signal transduction histidine kinase
VLVLLSEEENARYRIEVSEGAELTGRYVSDCTFDSFQLVENLRDAAEWPAPVPEGPAIVAPLTGADLQTGVLIVARPAHIDDATLLSTFAGQAALALERARAQEERELLAVLEDRERIARDLHDVVIQRLFATGMQLQGAAAPAGTKPEVVKRINAAVDDLDATIRDIRRSIFELRAPVGATLRTELRDTCDAALDTLGFRPTLETSGPVESAVPDDIVPELIAVLREALSNVARHAQANAVRVSVRVAGQEVILQVEDDGLGIGTSLARGGVVNMGERASDLGGSFEAGPRPDGTGTVVTWRVPVS